MFFKDYRIVFVLRVSGISSAHLANLEPTILS